MGAVDSRSGVLDGLEESLCRDEAVQFAVAFGSHVCGNPRPKSDVDVAVKFVEDLSDGERFRKRCFLSGDSQRTGAPFVDLADFDDLPVEVTYDAVNGDFLCGDEEAFRRYKSAVVESFEKQREDIRRRHRSVIDRIAEHGLHG